MSLTPVFGGFPPPRRAGSVATERHLPPLLNRSGGRRNLQRNMRLTSTHHRQSSPRRGSIALALLILVPVLFLLVVLGLHGIELRAVQTEMQNAADAAALA